MGIVRLLLDTHVFIWWLTGDARLSSRALDLIRDPTNELFLSSASTFEMSVKIAISKLRLDQPLASFVKQGMQAAIVRDLPIRMSHTYELADLPLHHRDPFDRLLVAQAKVENFTLLTADPQIQMYDVDTAW